MTVSALPVSVRHFPLVIMASSKPVGLNPPPPQHSIGAAIGIILAPVILLAIFRLYKRRRTAYYQRQVVKLERLWQLKVSRSK